MIQITDQIIELKEGWVFYAIRGNHFDGHVHVAEALTRGASHVYVLSDAKIEPAL